jgi:predicted DCC family thiol-disulfide oxidoreductase YuxK
MPPHLLLYDGACGLCRRSVAWVRRRDRAGRFEAVPYQDAPSPPMTAELREACAKAVHVITEDGRTLRGGQASMFVLGELGWRRTAAVFSAAPFSWAAEVGYFIVARNRTLAGKLLFRGTDRVQG